MKKKDNYNISQEPACQDAPCICGSYDHKKHPTCDPSKIQVKPTHTPTPWTFDSCKTVRLLSLDHKIEIGSLWLKTEQAETDAAFIIRAVNTHERWELLLTQMSRSACLQQRIGDKCMCFSCRAKEALAQAEGRSCS